MSAGSEDQTDDTPFVDTSGEHPTAPWRISRKGRCYGSTTGGECEAMGLEFDTIEEWEHHRARYHPVPCSKHGCDVLAAYTYTRGPHSCCFRHAPDDPDVVYAWKRTNTESVVEPSRADPDHPIEAALSGLGE